MLIEDRPEGVLAALCALIDTALRQGSLHLALNSNDRSKAAPTKIVLSAIRLSLAIPAPRWRWICRQDTAHSLPFNETSQDRLIAPLVDARTCAHW